MEVEAQPGSGASPGGGHVPGAICPQAAQAQGHPGAQPARPPRAGRGGGGGGRAPGQVGKGGGHHGNGAGVPAASRGARTAGHAFRSTRDTGVRVCESTVAPTQRGAVCAAPAHTHTHPVTHTRTPVTAPCRACRGHRPGCAALWVGLHQGFCWLACLCPLALPGPHPDCPRPPASGVGVEWVWSLSGTPRPVCCLSRPSGSHRLRAVLPDAPLGEDPEEHSGPRLADHFLTSG